MTRGTQTRRRAQEVRHAEQCLLARRRAALDLEKQMHPMTRPRIPLRKRQHPDLDLASTGTGTRPKEKQQEDLAPIVPEDSAVNASTSLASHEHLADLRDSYQGVLPLRADTGTHPRYASFTRSPAGLAAWTPARGTTGPQRDLGQQLCPAQAGCWVRPPRVATWRPPRTASPPARPAGFAHLPRRLLSALPRTGGRAGRYIPARLRHVSAGPYSDRMAGDGCRSHTDGATPLLRGSRREGGDPSPLLPSVCRQRCAVSQPGCWLRPPPVAT
ncbi:hypothetical protein C8R44DRAFT_319610 [Mycena epipterygia]|nr:hypothetical protein C8R44DRAFT_319610 [Mycena epipterygia]